jgi:molecular chaperone DnaK
VYLGGLDWDQRIADRVAEEFLAQDPRCDPRKDPAAAHRLLREAEDLKKALTSRPQARLVFEHAGRTVRLTLTREEFETLTADLLDRTRFTVKNLLREAQLQWSDLTRVLLVGGLTRMPAVGEMLEKESGMRCDRTLSPDEAVAHGAALFAHQLSGAASSDRAFRIRNVSSHNLGVLGTETATGRPRASVIIPRNTRLPKTQGKRYRTARDNQRNVLIRVIEGGDATGSNATAIGSCVIPDLPAGLPAGTPVDVRFAYAENGRLTIRGRLPGHDREVELTIDRPIGLSDARLEQWNKRLSQWTRDR